MEKVRARTGPALFSYGFRPFFLFGAVWAVVAMAAWVSMLAGLLTLPTAFDPVSWHAHEFLFGYLGAIIAGFLLTAVPNWTGQLPVVGAALAGLTGLWVVGRIAVGTSALLPPTVTAAIDLAFPLALVAFLAREIIAGRNWRNLIVLVLLIVYTIGNAVFHVEASDGGHAAGGTGLRLSLAAAVLMIAVIGGRVVPSFTRNWLVKRGEKALPAPPMQRFDKISLLVLLAALLAWVFRPDVPATGMLLVAAGGLHAVRLARWRGHRTGAEPLVWILHAGYAFVPLGALAEGAAVLLPDWPELFGAQHVWMAGAVGTMTLAIMTRATLGHTGRGLTAGPATTAIYLAIMLAAVVRAAAYVAPLHAAHLHMVAGTAWIAAFAGFAIIYGRLLLRPSPRAKGQ